MYALLFFALLTSCGKCKKPDENRLSSPAKSTDFNLEFEEWLNHLNLTTNEITGTSLQKAFELWAYESKLTKSDSSLYWYPSKDSLYFLITNFNPNTKSRITSEHSNDIELRFLKNGTKSIKTGLTLLDSLKQREINFYWKDSNTFYLIEKRNLLTKLKMNTDSIWHFSIKKSLEYK